MAINKPWYVLGDHPAALLTACALAKEGLEVVCAPLMPSQGVVTAPNGQCVDLESNWILGLPTSQNHGGILWKWLDRLGVPSASLKWVHENGAHLPQIVTPSYRVQWKHADEDFLVELARERGPKARPSNESFVEVLRFAEMHCANYFETFPRNTASIRQSLRLQSKEWGADSRVWSGQASVVQSGLDKPWIEAVLGWRASLGFPLPERYPTMFESLMELALIRTGKAFRGGIMGYRDFLLRLAVHLGAKVSQSEEECDTIYLEEGQVSGVKLRGQGIEIPVQGIVIGSAYAHASQLMESQHMHRRMRMIERPYGLKPTAWKFTLAMTVRSEGLSQGAGNRTLWFEESAAPLEIEVSSPDEYQHVHSDDKFVFLRTELPFEPKTLEPAYLNRMSARMFQKFMELHPFSEFHLVKVFPDFRQRGPADIEALSEVYGFMSLDMIPEHLRVYDRTQGLGIKTRIPNALLANGESYPQLGSLAPPIVASEIMHSIREQQRQKRLREQSRQRSRPPSTPSQNIRPPSP